MRIRAGFGLSGQCLEGVLHGRPHVAVVRKHDPIDGFEEAQWWPGDLVGVADQGARPVGLEFVSPQGGVSP
jgi:hypothetical protein